jgi:hypothetical protein
VAFFAHVALAEEGWDVERLRLFEAFEDCVSVLLKVNAGATPDAAVVQAIASVEEMIEASVRVEMRGVISAAVRRVARFVRDPLVMNRVMSYAGFMCSEATRVELMRLFSQSDVLSAELREWAREWACIASFPEALLEHPLPVVFDGTTKFKDHVTNSQPLDLPMEFLIRYNCIGEDVFEGEIFDITSVEMQDRLFDFFLGFDFPWFFVDEGVALARLVDLQLQRRSFSEVALRLSASQCITGTGDFLPCDFLKKMLQRVYSKVSRAQRNEALHALLATKRQNGRYLAHDLIGLGARFLMKQLFKSGASPLVRDASGVLLIANIRCKRLRSIVNGQYIVEKLDFDRDTCEQLAQLIDVYTPAKWTVEWHHLFPDDFRARVRQLLLCNQRLQKAGAAHLSLDPLELVIQWLAVGEVLGQEAIENEMAKLAVGEEEEDSDSDNDDDDD